MNEPIVVSVTRQYEECFTRQLLYADGTVGVPVILPYVLWEEDEDDGE
jgi:hypothetical protein